MWESYLTDFGSENVSPLNTVPRIDSDERRVFIVIFIVDLSWPFGRSVNAGIDVACYLGEATELHFPTVDHISRHIQELGPDCRLHKRDLKTAYRQFRVAPPYNLPSNILYHRAG